jgi:hypothetical protein
MPGLLGIELKLIGIDKAQLPSVALSDWKFELHLRLPASFLPITHSNAQMLLLQANWRFGVGFLLKTSRNWADQGTVGCFSSIPDTTPLPYRNHYRKKTL